MKPKKYRFFQHKECEYFPCHETRDKERFNCLFCYCPLYVLGDQCGGEFIYKGDIKDCSRCLLPHDPDKYDYVTGKFNEIVEMIKKNSASE